MRKRLGIDLGGTKIEVAMLDDSANELLRRRIPTPQGDYEGTVRAITALVESAQQDAGVCERIGAGTPGAISAATGLMKNANSVVLNGKPLKDDLERALGREIRMTNDANCFVLSEAFDGAAAGSRVVFGVILGTGTGGGISIDRRIVDGANHIAGEWGHNPLPWPRDSERPGPLCYCGKSGCMETFLSGPALSRLREQEGEGAIGIYADRLARGLASVINVLDPDVIVLGGGVSNVTALYDIVPELLRRYVFSDAVATRIVPARHGDSSGVRGAALLWP